MMKNKLEVEDIKGSTSNSAVDLQKEWDEISCSICMDHPHNAVVLICDSYRKGCRSYICDTSYRHSNCLDRFRKLRMNSSENPSDNSPILLPSDNSPILLENANTGRPNSSTLGTENIEMQESTTGSDFTERDGNYNAGEASRSSPMRNHNNQDPGSFLVSHVGGNLTLENSAGKIGLDDNGLKCPLCRGGVVGWMIVKEVRQYLDQKVRSCSRESCSFSGNYKELRRHARSIHPTTRPTEVDPSRQRAWSRLVHQQEYGDIVSAIRSAMPGAIVMGDHVIDDGEELSSDSNGPLLATLFLLHMISSPMGSRDERRTSSRSWRRRRRSSSQRYLWGENLLGLQNDDLSSDDGVQAVRRRRRVMRSRTENDQQ